MGENAAFEAAAEFSFEMGRSRAAARFEMASEAETGYNSPSSRP
jgi:hypothetical protein